MTFPSSDVVRTNADAGTDNPQTFRTDALDLIDKFNLLRNHFTTLAQSIGSRTSALLMRQDLGSGAAGDVVFTAATTIAARQAIGASPTGNISTAGTSATAIAIACMKIIPPRLLIANVSSANLEIWVEQVVINSTGLTALVLPDVEGMTGGSTGGLLGLTGTPVVSLSMPALKAYMSTFTITTCTSLTSASFPNLAMCLGQINIQTCAVLTTLNLALLAYVSGGIQLSALAAITTISLPELVFTGGMVQFGSNAALTSVSLPKLQVANSLNYDTIAVTTVSLPLLTTTFDSNYGLTVNNCANVTTISAATLALSGAIYLAGCAVLTTVTLTLLTKTLGTFTVGTNTLLTSIVVPALVTIGTTLQVFNNPALVNFALPTTLKAIGGNIAISGNALNQTSIDNILVRLAALDGTAGTTAYNTKTIALTGGTNATPSSTGLTAKATLVARGCTVTHN